MEYHGAMNGPGGPGTMLIFVAIWVVFMSAFVAGYIIFLVAAWRAMRAHESVAESLREIAGTFRAKQ